MNSNHRRYDSSRRIEGAQRTREAILDAAFRLHGRGIFDFESLAEEARVSLATVRKHFPTREVLFQGCTAWGGEHYAALPDLEAIAAIADPRERARAAVRGVYAFHESLFGQMWSALKFAEESAALGASVERQQALVGAVADHVLAAWTPREEGHKELRGIVIGLLSALTYRGLRVPGGLSPEAAAEAGCAALLGALEGRAVPLAVEAAYE